MILGWASPTDVLHSGSTTVKSRNVCVVTGTRADYGALRPVMQAIQDSPGLHLQVCITGMHLLKRFGQTGRSSNKMARLKPSRCHAGELR